MVWFADFETNYNGKEANVYLGYITNLENENSLFFLNIKDMFEFLSKQKTKQRHIVYFHNLDFDGEFIVWWLLRNHYTPVVNKVERAYQFRERVDWLGNKSELYINYKGTKILFLDSYKLWPYKISEIGDSLGFKKLDIDHKEYRNFNKIEEVPKEVLDYVKRDAEIIKQKYIQYSKNYKIKKTASSSSWNNFKDWYNDKYSDREFRTKYTISKENYDLLQPAYFGGLSVLNSKYLNKIIEDKIYYYDINSSYPSTFVENLLPYGLPTEEKPTGEYVEIVSAIIRNIKKKQPDMCDHLHNWVKFGKARETYISEYLGSMKVMYCREEWEEIKKTYDFEIAEIKSIYFKATKELGEYINQLYHLKEKETDKVTRTDHKNILNMFYGKWGQGYKRISRFLRPATDKDYLKYNYNGFVYDYIFEETSEIKYLPIAIFVTSYARVKLLKAIRNNKDKWLYCDTDSIITLGKPANIDIDSSKLGYWKLEVIGNKIKILKTKYYIIEYEDDKKNKKYKKCLAGINKKSHHLINFENFEEGRIIKNGNIKRKRVIGGYVINEEDIII